MRLKSSQKVLMSIFLSLIFYGVQAQEPFKHTNVILMIGDGMGVSHVYAGLTANHGILNILQFKNIGFSKTNSTTNYATDSGAGGTAIATGKKTYNDAVGVDADTLPLKTMLEYAGENGMGTGLVSTSAITDATPASFYAHQSNRYDLDQIAEDILKTDIDVFIGGGKISFMPGRDTLQLIREFLQDGYQVTLMRDTVRNVNRIRIVNPAQEGSYQRFNTGRGDSLDLIQELRAKGYQVIFSMDSIKNVTTGKLAGFTAEEHNPSIKEGRGNMLPEATNTAINILKENDKGFFLMVEGALIDKESHDKDTMDIAYEVIDFDSAVGIALDYARKDGNTLVVVTADHETAGMSLLNGSFETGEVIAEFNNRGSHTGVMVPVFAYGPGAESFQGIQENTDLFYKIMAVMGIEPEENAIE